MDNLDKMVSTSKSPADFSKQYIEHVTEILKTMDCIALEKLIELLDRARLDGHTVFLAGNGGSAATASHWANDLSLGTKVPGAIPFRAISLTDNVAVMTALANDRDYSEIFVGQLETLFREGDILIAISASGNSPNVLRAIEYVNSHGGTSVGIVGFDGGKMKPLVKHFIHVRTESGEYGPVEDVHMLIDHLTITFLKSRILAAQAQKLVRPKASK